MTYLHIHHHPDVPLVTVSYQVQQVLLGAKHRVHGVDVFRSVAMVIGGVVFHKWRNPDGVGAYSPQTLLP